MIARQGAAGPERVWLATGLSAMFLTITVVSLCGMLGRALGGAPWSPPLSALLSLLASVALGLMALRQKGPVARLAAWLPTALDGSFMRRRTRTVLAGVLLLIGVAQIARLSCFMSDDALRWGSAFPPVAEGTGHMCLASYMQAADLVRQDDPNIYQEKHYPAFSDKAFGDADVVDNPIDNIEAYIEDAYEYPPPFLLLPRLALAVSNDYMLHRTGWFMLQGLVFIAFVIGLTRVIESAAGVVALLLVPAVVASLPGMFTLQFGQWHMATVMLALGGMLAFTKARHALGGGLLAAAVVTKIFPGLLVVYLLARKQWRAVLWTASFSLLYVVLTLLVVGSDPFVAFVDYQLPRIASGEAFSFFLKSDLVIASNYGVYGIVVKLQKLGVPGMSLDLASGVTWVYGVIVLAVGIVAARRERPLEAEPAIWLSLLVLASLRSPLAPNVYSAAPAMWLMALVAHRMGQRTSGVVLLVLGFLTMGGLPPLPSPKATIALWMTGQIAMLALGFWAALDKPRASKQ